MSYTLIHPCTSCLKFKMELCIDSILLSASAKAFDKIPLNNNSGHCGAGTIVLNCENFTDIPKTFNYEKPL